jgi:hypothetical protein
VSGLLDGVDWEVVAVFAALVLLEGLRRVPAGGLVVRAIGWSGWEPAGSGESGTRWRLVSWWPPLAPALVLAPLEEAATLAPEELAARVRTARRWAPWLTAGSGLTLAALVLGLPVATARLGGVGFVAGAGLVLTLAVATAVCGGWALRRLDAPRALRRGLILRWCSPFASGRALEGVYEAAVAGASPAQALRALTGDRVFAEWARTRAYDATRGGQADPDLSAAADPDTLLAIVSSEPPHAEGCRSYCPRCAAAWIEAREACPDCEVPAVKREPEPRA